MHRTTDRFRTALLAGLYLGALITTAPKALSQTSLITTLEQPGVQNSTALSEATGVFVEGFNPPLPLGEKPKGFSSTLGTYSGGIIHEPNDAGGANATQFFQVADAKKPEILTFKSPQAYFGLWWSDADPKFPDSNTLTFSLRSTSGLTISLPFNTGNLLALINKQPNASAYFGNPNPSTFTPATLTKAYAFVNFFAAAGIVINSVTFSNLQETFSSDNHTIASSFGDIGGSGSPPAIPPGNTDVGPGSGQNVGGGNPVTVPPGSSVDTDPGSHVMVPGGTTVAPGATVTGNGMITTPSFMNHGIVSPGGEERAATIGTLTINGNYNQGPTGVLSISANGPQCPQSDRLVVTGTAVLNGGSLLLSGKNGFTAQPNTHYTILIAGGGLTGNFSQVVDVLNTPGLTRANITAANGVVITYLAPGFGSLNLHSTLSIDPNNPCAVDPILINVLDPNANELAAPFDVWINGLAQTTRFTLQDHFDDLMAAPTPPVPTPPPSGKQVVGKGVVSGKEELPPPAPAPEKPRFNLWGSGFGDWHHLSSDGPAHGFHYVNAGFLAGGDFHFLENYVVGLFGAYSHSGDSLLDGNTGWGGIYLGFYKRGAYILGGAYGGGGSFDTSRSTLVGGRATGTADTQQWASFVTVGYDFCPLGKLVIGPVFSGSYAYANMNGFNENSSFAPLRVSQSSQEDWRTDLGFRAWYGPVQLGKVGIRPFVRATWTHSYKQIMKVPVALLNFQDAATVTVSGPQLGNDFATINAGASIQWTPTISTYLSYDGQVGRDNAQSNGISGGFNISF